jgi:RNA polymerase sigma-70 factor (ECF subfamily)
MWLDADTALSHLDRLVAAARALCGNHADADDLVQEVYLTLLLRPRRLTGGSELAYLMTMLRNAQIDRYRAAARRQTSALDESGELEDPRAGLAPERAIEHREVLDAVHALNSPFRETVVAVDVLGLSYKEAGQALRTPVGTVMSRLARGRERVIAALQPMPEVARG